MQSHKILIIEDEFIISANLKQLLTANGYSVCGIADCFEEAIDLYKREKPDLVLSDIYLRDSKTGIEALLQLNTELNIRIPLIIISAYSEENILKDAITVNPIYFITKPFTESQILTAVNLALKLEAVKLEPELPSKRELEILKLLAQGLTSKQISQKLFVSFNTVESHRKNLLKKYHANTSAELIFLAASKNWLKEPN